MTRPPRYSQKFQLPILNQQLNSRNVETNDTAKQAAKDLNTKNYFTLADDLLHEQSTLPIQGRRVSIDGDDTIARSPIALPQLAAAPFPAIHSQTVRIHPPRPLPFVLSLLEPQIRPSESLEHRGTHEIDKRKQQRRQARPKGEWIGKSLHQPTNQFEIS
ncbi:hypothetical protein BLNAU_22753 [Blattamonas nauphoetae]|uniref:Uncharacterized protein n=1 Tax=Blattamonas nauphoetae TaxID=2049346 RepID=A0ABQ9WSL9_9EUKA|nr:hypothetical protein BLNAU_22753 [Blattamonas nauphoetae]